MAWNGLLSLNSLCHTPSPHPSKANQQARNVVFVFVFGLFVYFFFFIFAHCSNLVCFRMKAFPGGILFGSFLAILRYAMFDQIYLFIIGSNFGVTLVYHCLQSNACEFNHGKGYMRLSSSRFTNTLMWNTPVSFFSHTWLNLKSSH